VSNVQLDDNIRMWLLEKERFKSAPGTWKCGHRNNVFGQSIPDPRSRNVEGPTTDCRQSVHRHHQAAGAGRAECPPTVQICKWQVRKLQDLKTMNIAWNAAARAAALWLMNKRTKCEKYECIKTSENVRKIYMIACCNFCDCMLNVSQ